MTYPILSMARCCLFLIPGLLVACGGGGEEGGSGGSTAQGLPSAFVYVANYGIGNPPSGNVSAFSVTGDTGILSSVPGSPFDAGVGTVSIAASASRTLLYVLNQAVSLQVFQRNMNGQLQLLSDHNLLAFTSRSIQGKSVRLHPNGRWLYILSDSPSAPSILVFSIVETGPSAGQLGGLLQEFAVHSPPAEFAISGNFLFVVFPGTNVIAAATITSNGTLTFVQGSQVIRAGTPVSLAVHELSPFLYVAYFDAGAVDKFTIHSQTGAPTLVSRINTGTNPQSIAMDPNGQLLYVANSGSNSISGYRIDANGNLSALTSSPFPTSEAPRSAIFDPSGNALYVTHNSITQGSISSFTVDRNTGTLSQQGASMAIDSSPGQVISIRP